MEAFEALLFCGIWFLNLEMYAKYILKLKSTCFRHTKIRKSKNYIWIFKYPNTGWSIENVNYISVVLLYANFTEVWTFWYLAFKIPPQKNFVKIEVCEEIVRFSNIGEYTKENFINLQNWFIFAPNSLLFIVQKAVKAQIIVQILKKMLPNSGKNNLIDFLIKFHFIDFFAKLWLYFETNLWN